MSNFFYKNSILGFVCLIFINEPPGSISRICKYDYVGVRQRWYLNTLYINYLYLNY
jgi:hypothetical protein